MLASHRCHGGTELWDGMHPLWHHYSHAGIVALHAWAVGIAVHGAHVAAVRNVSILMLLLLLLALLMLLLRLLDLLLDVTFQSKVHIEPTELIAHDDTTLINTCIQQHTRVCQSPHPIYETI